MPPKRGPKSKVKLDPEALQRFTVFEGKLAEKEALLNDQFAQLGKQLCSALKADVDRFSEKNPEIASMRLIDYLKLKEEGETSSATEEDEKNESLPLPKVIHPKKTAVRQPRAHELLFSANGTPILYPESQKILTLTKKCFSQVTEVVTCSGNGIRDPMESFCELD